MAGEEFDYDLFVIGAGSGGVRAARIAAGLGARVAVCEDDRLGGTCVNVGCVPKKLLMYASQYGHVHEDARGFGWDYAPPRFDWRRLIHNKNREIHRLNGVYKRLLDNSGAHLIRGRGSLTGPHEVEVNGQRHTARHILVCTGGRPIVPRIPGHEHGKTSDEIFYIEELPRRIVIVGGGYIGVEFACIFAGMGAEVHLVHRREMILNKGFDDDITLFLADEMKKLGIEVNLGCTLTAIEEQDDGTLKVSLDDAYTMETDLVMWATGRSPNTRGLGLEEVGVELGDWGQIIADDQCRTSVASILACGDVVGKMALTPVALEEGMMIARNLFDPSVTEPMSMDYDLIPTAVFSYPNLGMVGLTEQEARARHGNVVIYRSEFRGMKHTLTGRDTRTLMKMVVDGDTDRVLGCHMAGPDAGEIIQGLAVALKAGATKRDFDRTVGIHPTAAEEFVTMRTPAPPPTDTIGN